MKTIVFLLLLFVLMFQTSLPQEVEGEIGEAFSPPEESKTQIEGEIGTAVFEEAPEEVAEVDEEKVEIEGIIGEAVSESIEGEIGEAVSEVASGETETLVFEDGWFRPPLSDIQSDEFSMKAIYFGLQYVVAAFIGENNIPQSSTYNISQFIAVDLKRENGILYRSLVEISSEEGYSYTVEYIVQAQRSVYNSFSVVALQLFNKDQNVEVNVEALEFEFVPLEGEKSNIEVAAPEAIAPEEALLGESLIGEIGEAEFTSLGEWVDLDPVESQDDPNISPLINNAVSAMIEKGLNEGTLPAGDWSLKRVLGVSRQVVEGTEPGNNWYFEVEISDGKFLRALGVSWTFQPTNGPAAVIASGFWQLGPVSI